MPVRIAGEASDLTDALNGFSSAYHADFFEVRTIGRQYLAEATPSDKVVGELARSLRCALGSWGAGKREAPELRGREDFASALRQSELRAALGELGRISLPALGIRRSRRLLHGRPAAPTELAAFDSTLFSALRRLADGLFIGNTNVTYPMKAVLLVTGLMPAFDNEVRRGLQRGGFLGMTKRQYLLPPDASHADGKKMSRLPFLLGECWTEVTEKLREGISNSAFAKLVDEPGRVFDVLLFMQGSQRRPVLITLDPPSRGWYGLP